jgi:hypothetical protein
VDECKPLGAGAEAWVEKQIAEMGGVELGVPYMLQRGVGVDPAPSFASLHTLVL